MLLGLSCYHCVVPLCDAIAICNATHFETQDEYQACIDDANDTVDDCREECDLDIDYLSDLGGCQSDCFTAKDIGTAACSAARVSCYADCVLPDECSGPYGEMRAACDAALAECTDSPEACLAAYAGCIASADASYAACNAARDAARAICNGACNVTFADCVRPFENTYHRCLFACETDYEINPVQDDKDAQDCAKHCCQLLDTDGGISTISKCSKECAVDNDDCLLLAINDSRTCLEDCLDLEEAAGWPDEGTSDSRKCRYSCLADLTIATNGCSVDKLECDADCNNAIFGKYKCCGSRLNQCYYDCERTYLDDTRDCTDTLTRDTKTCHRDKEGCLAVCDGIIDDGECVLGCTDDYDGCNSDAHDNFRECEDPVVSDRFDCRLECCANSRGITQGAKDYQDCWHSSSCEKNDPSTDTDCLDDLNICLSDLDEYVTDEYGNMVERTSCILCGPEAAANYSNFPQP